MGDLVRVAREGGIATITLDSQHNRNALSRQLLHELNDALEESETARVIVLGHEGVGGVAELHPIFSES